MPPRKTFTAAVLGSAIALTTGLVAIADNAPPASPPPAGSPSMPPRPQHGKGQHPGRFPMMMRARHQLQAAKASLQHAAHDFGGHRVKAIAAIDAALKEIELGMQAEKK